MGKLVSRYSTISLRTRASVGLFAVFIFCVCFAEERPAVDCCLSDSQGRGKDASSNETAWSGVLHVSTFDLPLSEFLSTETRLVLHRQSKESPELGAACLDHIDLATATIEDGLSIRRCFDSHYYPGLVARQRARYRVTIKPGIIAGVPAEIFTPVDGVSSLNRDRVLINLHGGSFLIGGRLGGQVESIPIAAVGGFKVVSIDYRMAPEHRFPAASEDVVAVYKALLEQYAPENIGIYGCSSGGLLTVQTVAKLQKQKLPTPGAVGIFCQGAFGAGEGATGAANDSRNLWGAITAPDPKFSDSLSYLGGVDLQDPEAYPGLAPHVMARFPDSLLLTSTRDSGMSEVVVTHSQLVSLGVNADLHVWEGLGHAFFLEPDLPESREVYDVVARFFTKHLGKQSQQ